MTVSPSCNGTFFSTCNLNGNVAKCFPIFANGSGVCGTPTSNFVFDWTFIPKLTDNNGLLLAFITAIIVYTFGFYFLTIKTYMDVALLLHVDDTVYTDALKDMGIKFASPGNDKCPKHHTLVLKYIRGLLTLGWVSTGAFLVDGITVYYLNRYNTICRITFWMSCWCSFFIMTYFGTYKIKVKCNNVKNRETWKWINVIELVNWANNGDPPKTDESCCGMVGERLWWLNLLMVAIIAIVSVIIGFVPADGGNMFGSFENYVSAYSFFLIYGFYLMIQPGCQFLKERDYNVDFKMTMYVGGIMLLAGLSALGLWYTLTTTIGQTYSTPDGIIFFINGSVSMLAAARAVELMSVMHIDPWGGKWKKKGWGEYLLWWFFWCLPQFNEEEHDNESSSHLMETPSEELN